MQRKLHRSTLDCLLLFFLAFAILWKGGKALDATWLLALLTSGITLADIFFVPKEETSSGGSTLWLIACAFLFWTVLSFMYSETRNYGFDEVIQTVSLFLIFQYAQKISRTDLQIFTSKFARTISLATLIACGIGLIVYTLQPVSRFVGTFFDYRFTTDYWPNAWAEFLLFAWPMMLWSLWGRQTVRKASHLKILSMALLVSCLLASYSRGAMVASIAQIFFLSAVYVCTFRASLCPKRILSVTASVLCIAVLFFLAMNQVRSRFAPIESVLKKATFTASEGTSSVSERSQFWTQALQFAKQKPFFGFGPYSFRFLQPQLQTDVLATSDHPHNVFLKLAMERGIIASILFFLIAGGSFLFGCFRMIRESREGSGLLTLFLLTSVLGVLLHNLIDYNLQFVGISMALWIALGLLSNRESKNHSQNAVFRSFGTVLIVLLLLVSTVVEGRFLLLSSHARKAEAQGNYPSALILYASTDASFFPRDAWLSRAAILIAQGNLWDAQKAIDHGKALNAHDYRMWKLQGDVLIQQKNFPSALAAFEKAYKLGRYNDLGITRVLIELLRHEPQALDSRRHELELLLNDFGLAIEENTHFIDLSSNVEELVRICNLFASIYPAEASIYHDLANRAMSHAVKERTHLTSRPRGLLW